MTNVFFTILRKHLVKASVCLLILIFNITTFSATLSEYKESIQTAIIELEYITYDDADYTAAEKLAEEKESLLIIKNDLLKISKIDNSNFDVDLENAWLKQKLIDFEKLPAVGETRLTPISEAIDRLSALVIKINEVEKQSISSRSKDEDKQKLDEILNRPEFQKAEEKVDKPEKEKSAFEKWLDDIKQKISDFFASLLPQNPLPNVSSGGMQGVANFLQILIVGLALAIIGYLVYRFLPYFSKFRRKEKKQRKSRVILGETILANQDSTDVFAEAENLAKSGDTRGAIRKGYIAVLCGLSDKKIIGLEQHKTNRDYLFDLRKRDGVLKNMRFLTNSFERHWYGFDAASDADWQDFRAKYKSMESET